MQLIRFGRKDGAEPYINPEQVAGLEDATNEYGVRFTTIKLVGGSSIMVSLPIDQVAEILTSKILAPITAASDLYKAGA